MNRPIHFEIHADNPERAIAFYSGLFGWRFQKWGGPTQYWLVATGEGQGINGGLVQRQGPRPAVGAPVNGCVNTTDVVSCDAAVSAIVAHGGTIALPKMAIPGMGWLAYGIDPEGNIFGVMSPDPEAK